MNKLIKLLRDSLLLIFPVLVCYLFIIVFIDYPNLVEYKLLPIFSLFIGGLIVGWLFRKEHGDPGIRTCLSNNSKLYISFLLHSLYLAIIISLITLSANILANSSFNILTSAPLSSFAKITIIAIGEKWVYIYAPMIIGSWLFGWKTSSDVPGT